MPTTFHILISDDWMEPVRQVSIRSSVLVTSPFGSPRIGQVARVAPGFDMQKVLKATAVVGKPIPEGPSDLCIIVPLLAGEITGLEGEHLSINFPIDSALTYGENPSEIDVKRTSPFYKAVVTLRES